MLTIFFLFFETNGILFHCKTKNLKYEVGNPLAKIFFNNSQDLIETINLRLLIIPHNLHSSAVCKAFCLALLVIKDLQKLGHANWILIN